MATIYNSNLTKELTQGAKLSTAKDIIPNQLAEKVVPVMEVNPKLLRTARPFTIINSLSNQTSVILYTTSNDKDTYLTSACLSMIKDVTSTATDIRINVIDKETGTTGIILRIAGITLTVGQQSLTQNFVPPLLLKRGSNITLTSDTNVANIIAKGALVGFEDDTSNA